MSDKPLSPSRQVVFHQMLVAARKSVLMDALSKTLGRLDPTITKKQLLDYVPAAAQKILAAAGIRDEHVFPVPAVLEKKPTLVGYYRLLLGISQKRFYRKGTGMGPFKSMETRGLFNPRKRPDVERFCTVMAGNLAELVRQISPQITARDVSELPLLTLGAQLYGSNNNAIGKQATLDVFLSVVEIVKKFIVNQDSSKITVHNASKRKVIIALSSDPDIRIQEEFEGKLRNILAIEIKGGADVSNAHNRAGEAEKSHRKAKKQDFRDYWTIISLAGVDPAMLQQESPTTNSWFDVAQVLARKGKDWKEFRSRFAGAVGIPMG
ncbi:putative Type-2 restriction enzyme XcyI [Candidatus Sulfopaludibacter sp. SbA4]|nr:putative Type-2 restriction enzyme XcyI [Candidatus Sulfopaludibacter sp. SbA4]